MAKEKITEAQKARLSEAIYQECEEVVQWSITRRFGHLGQLVVHDALQETWKKMIEHFDDVYPKSHDARVAWLITVAGNYIIDTYRATERVILVEDVSPYMEQECEEEDPVFREVSDRIIAGEILERFTDEEKHLLFGKRDRANPFSKLGKKNRKNAENCKRCRTKKKLERYMKENGLDEGS